MRCVEAISASLWSGCAAFFTDNRYMQVKAFNKEFLPTDNGQLFELILAANYLNIKSLLDITCQAVAEQIRGKTPQQIRENFGIEVCAHPCRCSCAAYVCAVDAELTSAQIIIRGPTLTPNLECMYLTMLLCRMTLLPKKRRKSGGRTSGLSTRTTLLATALFMTAHPHPWLNITIASSFPGK